MGEASRHQTLRDLTDRGKGLDFVPGENRCTKDHILIHGEENETIFNQRKYIEAKYRAKLSLRQKRIIFCVLIFIQLDSNELRYLKSIF